MSSEKTVSNYSQKIGIFLGATVMLVSQPLAQIASAQVRNLQLQATEQGFNLKLTTNSDQRPQIFTVKRDNVLVTDLTDTRLNLDSGNRVEQNNPFPGVEFLSISQAEANAVRIIVKGTNDAPLARIQSFADGEVTLSFSVEGAATSPPREQTFSQEPAPPSDNQTETQSEVMFPNPEITVNGQAARNNQSTPRSSPGLQPTLPRAVAPPVGDIAVSTINSSPNLVNLGANVRVPRLVLREAPVREVLSLLARSANVNLVFADQSRGDGEGENPAEQTISVDLENESVQQAFNAILQLSGLEANRRGNTVFVGANLPQPVMNIITRTLRLNEVSAADAASFLGTQGAATQQVFNEVEQVIDPETQRIIREIPQPPRIVSVTVDEDEQGDSPLLLTGLSVSTDQRLNSITLVGQPRQVKIATDFIKQLDARRRQVAVNVKIIDVNLLNTENFNTSFSFGIADTFFSVDGGSATVGVGELSPPSSSQVRSSPLNRPLIPNPNADQQIFFDPNTGTQLVRDPNTGQFVPTESLQTTDAPESPFETGVTDITPGRAPARATDGSPARFFTENGEAVPLNQLRGFGGDRAPLINPDNASLVPAIQAEERTEAVAPRFFDVNGVPRLIDELTPFGGQFEPLRDADTDSFIQALPQIPGLPEAIGQAAQFARSFSNFTRFPNQFLGQLQAQVTNGNAKILSDPTLIVQEGQQASVNLTSEVFGGIQETNQGGVFVRNPIIKDAGLIVSVNIGRVDDNGFISLNVNPTVSSVGQTVSTGTGQGNITLLQERQLTSGEVRLRDGQTLILAGIIQDSDRVDVTKVPLLGDIPVLGALFRSTNRVNERQEVIVLLTPRIIDDSLEQSDYGVNYQPGPEARELLRQEGYPLPQPRR